MRDYLYCFVDPIRRILVASGIEFKDFEEVLGPQRNLLLLQHNYRWISYDSASGFNFAKVAELTRLIEGTKHRWGTLCWADFDAPKPPKLSRKDIARLTFFAHKAEPFARPLVPALGNMFLYSGHDDDWSLRLAYRSWRNVARLLLPHLHALGVEGAEARDAVEQLRKGHTALWVASGKVVRCPKSQDIGGVLSRFRPVTRARRHR